MRETTVTVFCSITQSLNEVSLIWARLHGPIIIRYKVITKNAEVHGHIPLHKAACPYL